MSALVIAWVASGLLLAATSPPWKAQDITCDSALIGSAGSSTDVEVKVSAPAPETGFPTVSITTKKAMEYVVRVDKPSGCKDCWASYELKLASHDDALKIQSGEKCPVWPDFPGGNVPNNTIKGCKREGIQWYQDDAAKEPATRQLNVTGIAGEANSKFTITVAYSIVTGGQRGPVQVISTSGTDYIAQPQPRVQPSAKQVEYEGYVIDLLCVLRTDNEPGWITPDGIKALEQPEAHHDWCLKMDVCQASGYGLLERRELSASGSPYALKYRLDKIGNEKLVSLLKNITGTNITVKATGVEASGQVLMVSKLSVMQAPPRANQHLV